MKIVYTYWNNKGQNPYMNFSSMDSFEEMGNISLDCMATLFDKEDITIYTDEIGYETINDIFDYNIEVVEFGKFRPSYWNYPKLVTYSLQEEPFIHLDFDLHLFERPSDEILSGDIISEKMRARVIPKMHCPFVDPKIWAETTELICSGLIGGNNLDVFKQLKKYADEVVNSYDHIVHFNSLVGIEEVYITHLSKVNKLKVKTLDRDTYKHYQSVFYK